MRPWSIVRIFVLRVCLFLARKEKVNCDPAPLKVWSPVSWAASASALLDTTTGLVRCGLFDILGRQIKDFGLKPVIELCSALMDIKLFPKGHNVGYGGHYQCPQNKLMGYGDGYPFTAATGTPV